ncbi:MAG: RrF2 family transcriptional regulator [Fidelibacterota bacterium]
MSLIFSRSCEYALQSIIYLAAQPPGKPSLQRDISKALNIPPHFLGKILQSLTHHEIVSSQKGKSGGFILNKPADEISLMTVVKITDGDLFLEKCVIGFPGCDDDNACPLHSQWSAAKKIIMQMLKNKHVAELSEELKTKLDYIAAIQLNE